MKDKTPDIPLWEHDMPDICRFCAYARRIPGAEEVYCEKKKQISPEDSTCRKYKYDILKKDLRRREKKPLKYSKEQFEI